MTPKNKFRIKDLDVNKKFYKCSLVVLKNKFNNVIKLAKKYLKNETNENLHQLRISLRRLRYVMEIFVDCYNENENEFELAYKKIQKLQDELGKGRDLDVLLDKINLFDNTGSVNLRDNILIEKENIQQTIKKELIKFVYQKNEFNFLIKKK